MQKAQKANRVLVATNTIGGGLVERYAKAKRPGEPEKRISRNHAIGVKRLFKHHVLPAKFKPQVRARWLPKRAITGAPLLTMPGIPLPLHKMAPRTLLDKSEWDAMRRKCYRRAGRTCEVCGVKPARCEAHELYTVDYENHVSTFERCVCLCPACHRGIHCGLNLEYHRQSKVTASELLETAEHTFRLVDQWNRGHSEAERLRLYDVWLDYVGVERLRKEMIALIKKYDQVRFYSSPKDVYQGDTWWQWLLNIGGDLYPTIYPTPEDRREMMKEEKRRENRKVDYRFLIALTAR